MDLERDLFTVSAAASSPTADQMIEAIREQGFEATVVPAKEGKGPKPPERPTAEKKVAMPRLVQDALDQAKEEGKLVLVDFYADWCAPCKRMLKETYQDERVIAQLKGFVFLKVDTDAHPDVAKHFKVSGIPDARILVPDGTEMEKLMGFKSAEELLPILKAARAEPGGPFGGK